MAETVNVTSINENPLCARLQKKFAGRGAASAGTKAVKNAYNTVANSEIAKTANPFEETSEFVRAGKTTKTATAYQGASKAKVNAKSNARTANAYNAAFEKTATFERAYARAAGVRAAAADINAQTRQMPKVKAVNKTTRKTASKVAPKSVFSVWAFVKSAFAKDAYEEKAVKSTPISKGLVLSAVVIAFIIVLMLFSIAQINEFKNEISGLQADKAELLTQIDDLHVAIDAKNDIRFIESEATGRIGMVKSNQVATKYVSISGGERVEVVDGTEEASEAEFGVFGTLMSVVGTNWDHLMEYIN